MSKFEERADGLRLWATEGATPEVVAERLVLRDREAFLWHCLSMSMSDAERARVEGIAESLLAGGYTRNDD